MPTDSIQLQIVKNGGPPATGAITASFGDTIVLGLGSTASGIRKVKYRIYEFPDGFALPAGWTQETANCYSVVVQNGVDAPAITMPASGNNLRGKYFFDAVGNDKKVNGRIVSTLLSKAQVELPMLSGSLEDIGYGETNEFDPLRRYVRPLKKLIRTVDQAVFSIGGVLVHSLLSGLSSDDHPQYLLATGTRALSGDLSAGGHHIKDVPTPTAGDHIANKDYVDSTSGFSPAGVPVAGDVVRYDGTVPRWGSSVAYAITAFTASVPVLEVGDTANSPAFTAGHSSPPTSLVLTNTDNGESKNVVATPTGFTSSQNYMKTANNATVTFTITGSDGISPANRSVSVAWRPRVYFGTGAAGGNSEAFIEALAGNALQPSRAGTFSVNATGSLRVYWAAPASYGTPTFTVGGFSGGFSLVSSTISVTNALGVTQLYQLWVSDVGGLGAISVTVS